MTLYPVRELYAGALFFPIDRSAEVLHAWREWTETVPDEVTSIGRILRFPPLPEVPEALRGRASRVVEAAYLGDASAGAELLQPLRDARTRARHVRDDPRPRAAAAPHGPRAARARRGRRRVARRRCPRARSMPSWRWPARTPTRRCVSIEIRHLGGALARDAPGGGAQPKIDAQYAMFAAGVAPTPELREARARARASPQGRARRPGAPSYDYYNFARDPRRGGRRAPARRLRPAAGDQGRLRPRPGDRLRPTRSGRPERDMSALSRRERGPHAGVGVARRWRAIRWATSCSSGRRICSPSPT